GELRERPPRTRSRPEIAGPELSGENRHAKRPPSSRRAGQQGSYERVLTRRQLQLACSGLPSA
ncbi:hypothetical protein, partial [Streptomyces chartreusis]|uniref:hypothetical protein n=1 Tax=Streptomyces chartreusis TaxID=1969 RepID=UPI00367EEFD2